MTREARAPGWFPDPTRRHRQRYRAGEDWTEWVADDAHAVTDPLGAELAPKAGWYPDPGAHRSRWWNGAQWTAHVWDGATGTAGSGTTDDAPATELPPPPRFPPTVVRSSSPDEVITGSPGATTDSFVRRFRAHGDVNTTQAAEDLVAALRQQGYDDLDRLTGLSYWSGSCHATSYCTLEIEVDDDVDEIVVRLIP